MVADDLTCPFEKPILSMQCGCPLAARAALGERLRLRCSEIAAQDECAQFRARLRDNARFAVRAPASAGPLAFGKEMRIMLGGVRGLAQALAADAGTAAPGVIEDIHGLLQQAKAHYGSLAAVPYARVVREIAATRINRSRPKPKP
jgi:hypothetical protein